MPDHSNKNQKNQDRSVANQPLRRKKGSEAAFEFVDNRPEAIQLARLQEMADNSPQAANAARLQAMADNSPQAANAARLQIQMKSGSATLQLAGPEQEEKEEDLQMKAAPGLLQLADPGQEELLQGKAEPVQKRENNTGMPDGLKSGVESLSGLSMDDVNVHYNSAKPAEVQALAYTQGTDIHVGPGQENHLPHEAWHVAQQKQGRVRPTMRMAGTRINDDSSLEAEADEKGAEALNVGKRAGENLAHVPTHVVQQSGVEAIWTERGVQPFVHMSPGVIGPVQRRVEEEHTLESQTLDPVTLENVFGKFTVTRSVNSGQGDFGLRYSIVVTMVPYFAARFSKIDFVQTVRTGVGTDWKTTAADFSYSGEVDKEGMPIDEEGNPKFYEKFARTEQTTGTGWRIDMPGLRTPFYSQGHASSPDVGKYYFIGKSTPVILRDDPTILKVGYKFEAITTAMDTSNGNKFGAVEWGFRVDPGTDGNGVLVVYTPSLLEGNLTDKDITTKEAAKEREKGLQLAFKQWNEVYAEQNPRDVTKVPGVE